MNNNTIMDNNTNTKDNNTKDDTIDIDATLKAFGLMLAIGVVGPDKALTTRGHRALHLLVMQRNVSEIICFVRSYGADVNVRDHKGNTPLHLAVKSRSVDVCRTLLDLGADADTENAAGETPLYCAAALGLVDICAMLVKRGAVTGCGVKDLMPLHIAACRGFASCCRLLLDNGADPRACDSRGMSALHRAAAYNHADLCRMLIAAGADVDAANRLGDTPLHYAAENGSAEACAVLLQCKADVNRADKHGRTPLHMAAARDRNSFGGNCIRMLVRAGADLGARDAEFGETPLHYAAGTSRTNVNILLRLGADPNAGNALSRTGTPLYCAVKEDKYDACLSLIAYGAKVRWEGGDTPLHAAMRFARPHMVKLLLKNGADPCAVNEEGDTPLHVLGFAFNTALDPEDLDECIRLAVEAGASVDESEGARATPLLRAVSYGRVKTYEALLRAGAREDNATEEQLSFPVWLTYNVPYGPSVWKARRLARIARKSGVCLEDIVNEFKEEIAIDEDAIDDNTSKAITDLLTGRTDPFADDAETNEVEHGNRN